MASLDWVDLLAEPNTDAIAGGNSYEISPVNGTMTVSADPWNAIFFGIFLLPDARDDLIVGDPTILHGAQIFGIEAAGNFAGSFITPKIEIYRPETTISSASFNGTYMFEEDPLLLEDSTYRIMRASCWYPDQESTGASFTLTKFKVYVEVDGFFWTNRNLTLELPL